MCEYTEQALHAITQMTARATDTGSETEAQQVTVSHALGTEYERHT